MVVFLFVAQTDTWNTFPILVILLYPAWYIFMAASIYMTVAVAVNRCLEIKMLRGNVPRSLRSFLNSGVAQSLAVFLWANVFILPRWFEYKIVDTVNVKNVTLEDNVTIVEVNETVAGIDYTWLRKNDNYNLYYWGIMNPTCFLVIPLTIMVVSTILMLRQLRAVTASLSAAVIQRNHEKRNRSISVMLIGIITLFVICHLGKVIFSCYQLWGGIAVYNEQWVKNLIIVNDTLAVSNSSLNFAIYCKDLLFRQCAGKVYHKFLQCPQCPTDKNAGKSETFVMGETSRSSDATPLQSPEMTR